ncbi:type I restriction enzyme HsdR N-terminal domain-containing protein [Ruminiclostridium herbifermentans]|uniref:Type I restriction enzyme HsdR N-terminal domain-containing protein n=1 Tax=Ruminiclostridium herbifermentans TaxID=2488810 RepID=A0A4U7J738_9FIRM|nr:type I restriction endonuclease [Ruminiclostridium herbifermentans]QNU66944.1 type I restriction enzyme HsdR N-terminal domain-containing protein [Ruminiclostridium herbifermentans]
MDFIDEVRQFSARVQKLKDQIPTEEATKMSLIVPFFQLLGYDVFNPDEFMPEFTADVGIKKGEKVDYAIMKNGSPVILIECKWCGESLDKHSSQLFRYFGTSSAKFGILTNGITYNFYTDLDESNKMDLTPFLEFDILNIKPNIVAELKKFSRDSFDVDNIFSTASELKYSKAIKLLFSNELKEPSDDFVKYILSKIYDGVKTQNVIDKYRGIIKKSLNDYISELMNEKISFALKSDTDSAATVDESTTNTSEVNVETVIEKIHTTDEEIESYYIVKSLLIDIVKADDITYKDNERYFAILYKGNIRKTICRINLDTKKKQIMIPDENKDFTRFYIDSINDIYSYKENLIKTTLNYIDN